MSRCPLWKEVRAIGSKGEDGSVAYHPNIQCGSLAWMSQEVSKRLGSVGYNPETMGKTMGKHKQKHKLPY